LLRIGHEKPNVNSSFNLHHILCSFTDQDDEEYSEGYLDIVPDSSPQDMPDRKEKPSYPRSASE